MLKFARPLLALPSLISLIAANCVPLFGVLFYGWSISSIMFLYWAESAIIGGFTILKIKRTEANNNLENAAQTTVSKAFYMMFFPLHYGIFMFVHLIFVIVFFNPWAPAFGTAHPEGFSLMNLFWSFLSLLASHSVSYFTNFLGKGEYKVFTPDQLFLMPYPRIVVMHLTIIFGALLVGLTGQSIAALALLIILKTIVDIAAHLFEHRHLGSKML